MYEMLELEIGTALAGATMVSLGRPWIRSPLNVFLTSLLVSSRMMT